MKRIALAVFVLCVVATGVVAEWNESKQEVFVERLANIALQMQDSREECQRIVEVWLGEGVATDPAFVDHQSGLSTAEMSGVIAYCQDFIRFNENQAVPASQRRGTLTPFLSRVIRAPR